MMWQVPGPPSLDPWDYIKLHSSLSGFRGMRLLGQKLRTASASEPDTRLYAVKFRPAQRDRAHNPAPMFPTMVDFSEKYLER